MTGGVATVSGTVATVGMGEDPGYNNPNYIATINISGSATFVVPSCSTPNVTVNLGSHKDSDFPSIGSQRGASGTYSDFSIDLTRCYTEWTSLSYSLHPLNGAVAGMPGLMNLTPASSARGVGIRLMDRSNRYIALDTATQINLASGSRYILLRAAIERTALGTFAGGSVQGQVEFSISYN
ncbi:MAG: fimbrial protein [Stenotrophomonas sp.]